MTSNEGPKDLSARFVFGASARRADAERRARDIRLGVLRETLRTTPMTDEEAFNLIRTANIGHDRRQQLRDDYLNGNL